MGSVCTVGDRSFPGPTPVRHARALCRDISGFAPWLLLPRECLPTQDGSVAYSTSVVAVLLFLTRRAPHAFPLPCRPWGCRQCPQVLLQGEAFSGKTALMAHTAVTSGFPFIRKIAADELIGMGEVSRCLVMLCCFPLFPFSEYFRLSRGSIESCPREFLDRPAMRAHSACVQRFVHTIATRSTGVLRLFAAAKLQTKPMCDATAPPGLGRDVPQKRRHSTY